MISLLSIRSKIILVLLLLCLGSIGISGWWLYHQAEESFDEDLGERLVAIAQAASVQFEGTIIAQWIPDRESRTYLSIHNTLRRLQKATGAARLYVFDRDRRSLGDTQPGIAPGSEYIRLRFDRFELEQVWQGRGVSSVRFEGIDNLEYKSGYAPIYHDGTIVAAVGVDMSAGFLSTLHRLKRQFWLLMLVVTACTFLLGVVLARRMTTPIHQLVAAARRIRDGELETPITIDTKDELGYLSHTMDEMRQSILERDAQLKLMLANVAHEIRNPLGGIELFAGLVAEDLSTDAPAQEHLSRIRREAGNLNRIITEFLEFARPLPCQPQDIPIQIILDDLSFLILHELQECGIRYEDDIPDVKLHVDPEQIKRAFLNLFRNAIQAMPNGGTLSIHGEIEEMHLRLVIRDTGTGIAKENLDKLFDPFFTTKEKGAGLGLAIVKRNIELNGGRIEICSEEGRGTTVRIALPLAQQGKYDV